MSTRKTKKKQKGRTQRLTSNIFAMFNQAQIQEYKEAFNMIDQNRDGYIDKDDLLDMMVSLGKDPSNEYLEQMIREAPGPINFTMFLTLFGEKLNGTDPKDEMVDDLFHGAPIKQGKFDYEEFTRILKHGPSNKDDDEVPSLPPEEQKFKPAEQAQS
ncbi:hypothetical protein KUTeg_000214 [Tegillarca granosa]|uniref:EF-hand domain-containing protein n=1 Tax=Tegillarca granosa TaxID=220873 RepID=A0ABQ9FWW2_TEGGR|nr:hypothetical protein KUTeg_000214 [Tegillarca granosa]